MNLLNIGQTTVQCAANMAVAFGAAFGVAQLMNYCGKREEFTPITHSAILVACAAAVFFAGKQIGYSTFPIAVGFVSLIQPLIKPDEGHEWFFLFALSVIGSTAMQRFGFLPQTLL